MFYWKLQSQASTRRIAAERISERSVRRYPYKPHLLRELLEDDFHRKMIVAEIITNKILLKIFFYEALFKRNNSIHRYNYRY